MQEDDLVKNFDPILDDYAFFEAHSTEAENDLKGYTALLNTRPADTGILNMLDFGAGTGTFTSRFLQQFRWKPGQLKLTLVEPGETARQKATLRLGAFSDFPVADHAALPAGLEAAFELVLCNHALYYVPDISGTIRQLYQCCKPGGQLLTAMAGRENALIQCWELGFGLINQEIPYHIGDDLYDALQQMGLPFRRELVEFTIAFPDTIENRKKILRFLFGKQLDKLPEVPLIDFFKQYSQGGNIRIHTSHYLYSISPISIMPQLKTNPR